MNLKPSNTKQDSIKHLILLVLMFLLMIPGIQGRFKLFQEPALDGAFEKIKPPTLDSLNVHSWLTGSFQQEYDQRLEHNFGFRGAFVKINNQIDFSLFNKANAEGIIVGKNNMLYEEDYIREYLGLYYVGDSVWIKKAMRLKQIQDTLNKLGKTLLVIFEPDKASLYPEYFPENYRTRQKALSNYDKFTAELKTRSVNFLDLNKYFISIKESAEYPIFPQCGTHWSYYGSTLAADTTIRFLEKLVNIKLTNFKIVENKLLDVPRHPDYDMGLAMNLMFMIPHPKTADPVLEFTETENTVKPHVLVVGDSFYFNWLNNGIPKNVFASCDFWYYNNNITHSDGTQDGKASDLNLREEVMNKDIIIMMVTGRFIHSFAWGFDNQLYDLFYPNLIDPVELFEDQVRVYGDLFARLYSESVKKEIPLNKRIYDEATYLFTEDIKKNPGKYSTKEAIIISYELAIRNTPEWFKDIERKAKENKITVEKQLRLDAEWIYNDKYGKK